jgi:AGZA family xanthine/uracil permease-like MFS transporter
MLDRVFALRARGTTAARELRGGVATFLTMSYIVIANPSILAAAGVPLEAAAAATAAVAALASLLMGLGANFPLALAPGMGLNAVVAFQLAPAMGSWEAAMGLVVLDGVVVLALVLVGVREAVMLAIPADLRRAIGVGIGLFIAFIGLVNARIVIVPPGTVAVLSGNPAAVLPPVTHGAFNEAEPLVALVGVLVAALLIHRRWPGAMVLGVAASTAAAAFAGLVVWPEGGVWRWPSFETVGRADVATALSWRFVPLLLSVVMVDFFDTIGTVTAVAEAGDLADARGAVPGARRILAVDAASASLGGMFGASSATAYIESAAGVAEGARTGLHNVVVAALFGLAVFAAPLATLVPPAATAPALIVVGFLMCEQMSRIDFAALATGLPAFLILLLVPFTYSISHGIGAGFIAYVGLRLLGGRIREVHPLMGAAALAFALFFAFA